MAVATFTKSGTKATTPAKLDKAVFAVEVPNHELLKSAYVAYLANGRVNLAKTLKRGEVSGGGKKPWKQKGTGRARFGSSRNIIWRGGGIAFGPEGNENYAHKMNVTAKRQAVRQALTLAAQSDVISVVEDFTTLDGKTKDMAAFLQKVGAVKGNRIVCVVDQKGDDKLRATQNIPGLQVVSANYLNVYDILNADTIIISKKSLDVISEWLTPSPRLRSTSGRAK